MKKSFIFNSLNIAYSIIFLIFSLFIITPLHEKIKAFSPNYFLITCFAIVFFMLALIYIKILYSLNEKKRSILRITFLSMLFIVQFYLFWKTTAMPGWDAQLVMEAARDGYIDMLYFAKCPNNIFISSFLQFYLKCTDFLTFISPIKRMIILNVILIDLSLLFLFLSVKRVFGEIKADFSLFIGVFLIGFSPWVSIMYTDTMVLLFPMLLIYCIIRIMQSDNSKEKSVFSLIFGIALIVGMYIKVTVVIVLIALVIAFLLKKSLKFDIKLHKNQFLSVIIGVAVAFMFVSAINYEANSRIQKELPNQNSYGFYYYLEVGLRNFGLGNWNWETFNWSAENVNKDNYEEMATERIVELVKSYGVAGMIEHMYEKLIWTGTDGTFAYGMEGAFHLDAQETQDMLRAKLQNYTYYTSDFYQNTLSQFLQGVWLLVCVLSALSIFNKEENAISFIARLSIGGILLFLMIFESRSRYLFMYAPVIIFMAQTNFDFIYNKLKLKTNNGEKNERTIIVGNNRDSDSSNSCVTVQ